MNLQTRKIPIEASEMYLDTITAALQTILELENHASPFNERKEQRQ
jgi:hypothetical protein